MASESNRKVQIKKERMLQPPGKHYIRLSHHELSALIYHVQAEKDSGAADPWAVPCKDVPSWKVKNQEMPGRREMAVLSFCYFSD